VAGESRSAPVLTLRSGAEYKALLVNSNHPSRFSMPRAQLAVGDRYPILGPREPAAFRDPLVELGLKEPPLGHPA
jgi:hypothetical protein